MVFMKFSRPAPGTIVHSALVATFALALVSVASVVRQPELDAQMPSQDAMSSQMTVPGISSQGGFSSTNFSQPPELCVPMTLGNLIGYKGVVPVYTLLLQHCTDIQQSTMVIVSTTGSQSSAPWTNTIHRKSDDGSEKFYLYIYNGQETKDESIPYNQQFTGEFLASPAALADSELGPSLQAFAQTHGITWLDASQHLMTPSTQFILIVVDPDEATIRP